MDAQNFLGVDILHITIVKPEHVAVLIRAKVQLEKEFAVVRITN
jgi:hypothetical protein